MLYSRHHSHGCEMSTMKFSEQWNFLSPVYTILDHQYSLPRSLQRKSGNPKYRQLIHCQRLAISNKRMAYWAFQTMIRISPENKFPPLSVNIYKRSISFPWVDMIEDKNKGDKTFEMTRFLLVLYKEK
jgi:hypothetical protein